MCERLGDESVCSIAGVSAYSAFLSRSERATLYGVQSEDRSVVMAEQPKGSKGKPTDQAGAAARRAETAGNKGSATGSAQDRGGRDG
jgi:hypothetical protein